MKDLKPRVRHRKDLDNYELLLTLGIGAIAGIWQGWRFVAAATAIAWYYGIRYYLGRKVS